MVIELLVWLLNCCVVIVLTKRKKLGFVNVVNTNTFFYSNEKIVLKCYYRGGLQFFGHTFLEGAGSLGC